MKKPITAVLIGAGRRGLTIYGDFALKNRKKLKFVAVAEPIEQDVRNLLLYMGFFLKDVMKVGWIYLMKRDWQMLRLFVLKIKCTQNLLFRL